MNNGFVRNGFAQPGHIRALGTIIDEQKGGGVRAIRQKISRLPRLEVALSWLIDEVVRENRKDLEVQIKELHMEPNGRVVIFRDEGDGYWLTVRALDQLMKLMSAPPHAGSYLASIPSDRRAFEVNHILRRNRQLERPLVMRLRDSGAGNDADQVAYAAVTPRYTPVDPDQVANRLMQVVERDQRFFDTRAEVIFTGERTSIKLFHESDTATDQLAINESFASVLGLLMGDDKSSGIMVDISALRNVCLNLMLVGADKQGLFRASHIGNGDELLGQVMQTMTNGADLLSEFLRTYQSASKIIVEEPITAIEHLTGSTTGRKSGAMIHVPGIKPRKLSELINTAWRVEQDRTQKGIANSITKAAHSFAWPSVWTSRELERQASLLMALPEPRFRKLIDKPAQEVMQ